MKKLLVHLFFACAASFSAAVNAEPISDETLQLQLRHDGRAITLQQVIRKPLPFTPKEERAENSYRYTLLSADNNTLYTQSFYDPLEIYVDDFSDPANPKGGKERRKEATFHIKAPFLREASRIRFEQLDVNSGKWRPVGTSAINLSR